MPWDLVVADEAQHVKNARSATARALRTDPEPRPRRADRHPRRERPHRAVVDPRLGDPRPARQPQRVPQGVGRTHRVGARAHQGPRQFADLIGPFLLRRRKSDPGIAPELPAKTETDHLLGLTREQVVLYETLVRDVDAPDRGGRRGAPGAGWCSSMLTGLKQICNHPAHFLQAAQPQLRGRSEKLDLLDELVGTVLAEDGAVLVFTQYVAMARLLERHLAPPACPTSSCTAAPRSRERDAMVARFQAGRGCRSSCCR